MCELIFMHSLNKDDVYFYFQKQTLLGFNFGWSYNQNATFASGFLFLLPVFCQVCQHDSSEGHDLLYQSPITPVRPDKALFCVWSDGQGSFEKCFMNFLFCGLGVYLSSYNNLVWTGNIKTFVNYCSGFSFVFCGIYTLHCYVSCCCADVSLPYSQSTPNTWPASTEQFDLSPRVVIGEPGLVIHGPFDCWHAKCSVPIPKAESWCAGSFIFSCLTSDPSAITSSWYTLKQQWLTSCSPCCCRRDVWS